MINYLLVLLDYQKSVSPPSFPCKVGTPVMTVDPVAFFQCGCSPWWWPCANCFAFVSAGRGQRLSGEGKRKAFLKNVPLRLEAIGHTENISYLKSFSGVSSSFCLNGRDPHVSGWDILAERKLRDSRDPRCRNIFEGNQGNWDRLSRGGFASPAI